MINRIAEVKVNIMKKYFCILIASLITIVSVAQKKTGMTTMPDINKLMKMSPAELEAYKQQMLKQASAQAKDIATKGNIKLNEMVLPDFELKQPVMDIKRLSLIPSQPPTIIQLAMQ